MDEVSVLGYDVASLGTWFPPFRHHIVVSSSKATEMREDLMTLEDQPCTLSQNAGHQVTADATSHTERTDT